jgi:hypothetical protein
MEKVDRFLAPSRPARSDPEIPDPWPLSLRVFRAALKRALSDKGEMIAQRIGTKVLVVDLKHVREQFEKLQLAHGETTDDRHAERAAFKRASPRSSGDRLHFEQMECSGST